MGRRNGTGWDVSTTHYTRGASRGAWPVAQRVWLVALQEVLRPDSPILAGGQNQGATVSRGPNNPKGKSIPQDGGPQGARAAASPKTSQASVAILLTTSPAGRISSIRDPAWLQ